MITNNNNTDDATAITSSDWFRTIVNDAAFSPIDSVITSTYFEGSDGSMVKASEIVDFVQIMKQRMMILAPAFEKHEKYPELKAAYEHYLVLSKLCE